MSPALDLGPLHSIPQIRLGSNTALPDLTPLARARVVSLAAAVPPVIEILCDVEHLTDNFSPGPGLAKLRRLVRLRVCVHGPVDTLGTEHIRNVSHRCDRVDDVRRLQNAYELRLSSEELADVCALANVTVLILVYTRLSDVSALARVRVLDLSHTSITDVSALGGVHTLCLDQTPVYDVSALDRVHTLSIQDTQVTDVSRLAGVVVLVLGRQRATTRRELPKLEVRLSRDPPPWRGTTFPRFGPWLLVIWWRSMPPSACVFCIGTGSLSIRIFLAISPVPIYGRIKSIYRVSESVGACSTPSEPSSSTRMRTRSMRSVLRS